MVYFGFNYDVFGFIRGKRGYFLFLNIYFENRYLINIYVVIILYI